MLIGLGDGFNAVASDAMAIIQLTKEFVELADQETVLLSKDRVEIYNAAGKKVKRKPFIAEIDASDIEKGSYPHYMLKEIDEQPIVIRKIIQEYSHNGELVIDQEILDAINAADRLYIVAAGTSYHAGIVGKTFFEKLAQIPTEVHIASEFVYHMPMLTKKPLFIFLSQSGETADSRAVLVKIKELGFKALTITNVAGSTLSREADFTLLLHAGPEIAVASTKAYTAQVAVLAILAKVIADNKQINISIDLTRELGIVASAMEELVDQREQFDKFARNYLALARNSFYIGRGLDYAVCLEAALKLKEISYIQAEGFAGGELKHGTIALIEEGTPVFALVTQKHVNLSIRGNIKEVASRGQMFVSFRWKV